MNVTGSAIRNLEQRVATGTIRMAIQTAIRVQILTGATHHLEVVRVPDFQHRLAVRSIAEARIPVDHEAGLQEVHQGQDREEGEINFKFIS